VATVLCSFQFDDIFSVIFDAQQGYGKYREAEVKRKRRSHTMTIRRRFTAAFFMP
jgi:hypothetical protein